MSSDGVSEERVNIEPYIERWKESGLDESMFENLNIKSVSDLERLQAIVESIISLIQRLQPFIASEEIQQMRHDLNDIKNLEDVTHQFHAWTSTHAPWEEGYFRYYQNWSEQNETRAQYWNIIAICATLDESSWTSLNLFLPLFSNPENHSEIMIQLEKLVDDEQRQRLLLEKAVSQLNDKGFTVEFETTKIIDQFNEVEKMQNFSAQIALLELEIQSSILPYDPVLAETFTNRLEECIKNPSNDISTLGENVQTISKHLKSRLNDMNALLQKWRSEGYSFEERSTISPEELLEWEHLLPEIEQQYHRHVNAYQRWEEIVKLWDIEDSSIDRIAGRLEHTDTFLEKIDSLEQEWTKNELQGASLIERWEQLGFEMDIWRYKIAQDPRQALAELNQQIPFLERANEILDRILHLDTSLGGEDEVERRTAILRTLELDDDLLDEMENWIDKKTLRNTRHRRMLQSEWEKAAREGKVEADKTFSDLHSFEQAIASIEHQSRYSFASSMTSHAIERTKAELLRLEERGWNITELLQLLNKQPDTFFQQFPKAMEAMSRIASTQRRIANLDWRRDVNRAGEITLHVRNPLQLVKIEQQIPAFIRHLADRDIEDEDYTYTTWLPEQRPVLVPREQSLIRKMPAKVQPQSTLEEAHEAMLEAMDSKSTSDVEEVESVSNNEEAHNEATQEEWRPPNPNHLHDDGVSDENIKTMAKEEERVGVEPKTVVAPAYTAGVEGDLTPYERLLRHIGLSEEADILAGSRDVSVVRRALASHVGSEPRDVRVDRLLRLMLRLLPQGDLGDRERSELIDAISEALPKYNQWVRMRLESRHMGASGTFFEDANRLGTALHRVPGPGVRVPLHADTYALPEPSNLNELRQQTQRLIQSMNLPAAGGIN